jgi:hypothetical protein
LPKQQVSKRRFNCILLIQEAACANVQQVDVERNAINIRANRADSEYNSLQTEVSRQFSHGLFFRVAYTYGKDLDDASDVLQPSRRLRSTRQISPATVSART